MGNNFIQKVFAIRLKDEIKRSQSQSGGAFSAAAEFILKNGGIVYGAAQDENLSVVYERIGRGEELFRLKGSKYTQADLGNCFLKIKDDLQQGKTVLFSGISCYVSGLLSYLQKQNIDTGNLYTCDIVCHGVAKPQVYQDYLKELKKSIGKKKLKKFVFRDKRFGWRTNISSYSYGGRTMMTSNYVNIYESQYVLRESCFSCKYATTDRVADITVGDYWGIENVKPKFDDNTGVSLLILNSPKGELLFEGLKEECEYEQTSLEECMQPNLKKPTEKPKEYEAFWKDYAEKGFVYTVTKYCNYHPANDWEYLEKKNYVRRLVKKLQRMSGRVK